MKYSVEKAVLGSVPKIEISEKRYREYEEAHAILASALSVEEKYEVLISNYIEFEKQLLATATDEMVRENVNYSDFFGVRLDLNIRLVNLLTSARLYVDHLKHDVSQCVPKESGLKELVEKLFSNEYDAFFEYRFMEALRNYVQHKGLPVHFTSLGTSRVETTNGFRLAYSCDLATSKSRLKKDGSFKKAVLDEIEDRVDLKAAARRYVERLSNVHETIREKIASSVREARSLVDDARNEYKALYDGSLVGLSACEWDDKQILATVPLIVEWDDVRQQLIKRNRSLINLRKTYVTSDLKTHNK